MQGETICETNNTTRKKRRPFIALLKVSLLLLLVTLVAVVVYPAPILRAVFSRIEAQSGIILTFDRAYFYISEGSFLYIGGLTIQRHNHSASNFDLKAESVRMPAMVPVDFRSPILLISGLRGTFERVGNGENADNDPATDGKYHLQILTLKDSNINFIDRTLESPFQTTVQIENFTVAHSPRPSLFEPYSITSAQGQIDSAPFAGITENDKQRMGVLELPLGLLAPYAPVLDDIFVSGSMNIRIDDHTDATQKKLRVSIHLLPDCQIKSADEILAPAIQTALQKLDQSSVPDLYDLQRKIATWKTNVDALRAELDRAVQIIDRLKVLAPPDVRERYEKFKSQYDRATADYAEWNGKFETLVRELDRVKVRIVEDTFQHFIRSGTAIEIDLQEVEGKWEYDAYQTVLRLIERNYRAIIAAEYQPRIQELRDAVDRLFTP